MSLILVLTQVKCRNKSPADKPDTHHLKKRSLNKTYVYAAAILANNSTSMSRRGFPLFIPKVTSKCSESNIHAIDLNACTPN